MEPVSATTCSLTSCDRPVHTAGYCQPHYKRVWRTGDPQEHKPLAPPRRPLAPAVDHPDGTRTCRTCGERVLIDQFPKDSRGTLGRRANCKRCHSAAEMVRYNADPDASREALRARRAADLERARERDMERYQRDREKRIAIAIATSHTRRARLMDAEFEAGITVRSLRARDGEQCAYCNCDLAFGRYAKGERPDNMATLEHRVPISRGGGHTAANCVLACWRCNITKGAKTEAEWAMERNEPASQEDERVKATG